MTELIRSQLGVILVMTYCGLTAGLIYDLFTVFANRFAPHSKAGRIGVRMLGYAVISIITVDFNMYCQNGKITFTALVCFGIGLWLWHRFFYDIINPRKYE